MFTGQRVIRVVQDRRVTFAQRDDVLPIVRIRNIQRQKSAETPHVLAFGPVPGSAGLLRLQALQVDDDLHRPLVCRA